MGAIDVPVLIPSDITAIESHSGLPAEAFSTSESSDLALRRMKAGDRGCYFYRESRCAIYDIRPIDCRLFPFDIIEGTGGRLIWVAYTDLCPVEHDPRQYFERVKPLLKPLALYLRAFARVQAPGMRRQSRIELGPVDIEPERSG